MSTSKLNAGTAAIIRRSVRRGAISVNRADFYASLASRGTDISYLDDLHPVLDPIEDEDEFLFMYPPKPGQEREWEASRLAASAPRGEDMSDEEADSLFPPGSRS